MPRAARHLIKVQRFSSVSTGDARELFIGAGESNSGSQNSALRMYTSLVTLVNFVEFYRSVPLVNKYDQVTTKLC